jgi:glycine dehydrogenase subunit 1
MLPSTPRSGLFITDGNIVEHMKHQRSFTHPYIPNSAPKTKQDMLTELGAESCDEFYEDIPSSLRVDGQLDLPPPKLSEFALQRHVGAKLNKNQTVEENLSFLGGGCFHHHVPAICDEVNQRGEFLTAYAGEPYDDHGRFQATFEYASMMGDLLNMDIVNVPVYDGYQAAATAVCMAARIAKRKTVLVAQTINPAMLSKIRDHSQSQISIKPIPNDPHTGQLDLSALRANMDADTAAVFIENPSYLGLIETQGDDIAAIAHEADALLVVYAEPLTLGVLTPPADYGADIVCGDIQTLGVPMQYGGGHAGYIASRDEESIVLEYPSRLFGIAPTKVPGEYGFGDVAYERTSFAVREEGKEWVGTAAALYGITAGVYLATMGPVGMEEIGRTIMSNCQYAMQMLDAVDGVTAPRFAAPCFREFVVDFNDTGKSVNDINQSLLELGIYGGIDLSSDFPDLGQCALYCFSETHSREDIDHLASTLARVVAQ